MKKSEVKFENLTQREQQCAKLIAGKLSNQQAAEKLGITTRTLQFYISNLKCKLGCSTKAEIIRILKPHLAKSDPVVNAMPAPSNMENINKEYQPE